MLNQNQLFNQRYDDAYNETLQKEWTGVDPIPTSESQIVTPPTPEEAQEQGLLGQFIDGTSNAAVGLYAGLGYGVDELAVSASELVNNFTEEDTTYQARYISKYMDSLKRGGTASEVAEGIAQFMVGWMPWTRGIGLLAKGMQGIKATQKMGTALAGGSKAGRISSNFLATTMAGGTAFSPDHESMADALMQVDNGTQGVISKALATNPNDPNWKNRVRHGLIDGGVVALGGDLILMPALKGIGKGIASVAKDPLDKFIDGLHTYTHKVARDVQTRNGIVGRSKAKMIIKDGQTKIVPTDEDVALDAFEKELRIKTKGNPVKAEAVIKSMDKDGSLQAKFTEARTLEEKSELAVKIADNLTEQRNLKLGSVEVGNIKWDKSIPKRGNKNPVYKTKGGGQTWSIQQRPSDDMWVLKQGNKNHSFHEMMDSAKTVMAKEANIDLKKTIPKRTHAQLLKESQQIFDEVGVDAQAIRNLPSNMAWNDAQMYTFAKLVQSTQAEMIQALKAHANSPQILGQSTDKMLEGQALSAIANHADALTFLSGAKTAVARSMKAIQGVNKMVNQTIHADHINSPEIANLIRSSNIAGSDTTRMTQMILQAYEQNGSKMGGKSLIDGIGDNLNKEGGFWNQFVEAWINQGLLSNPATHALNFFSGSANIMGHIASQTSAAVISKLPFVENKILFREAFGSMYGLMIGLNRAFRLSLRAGMTGTQVVTKGAKIENYGMKHIAAKHIGKGIGGAEDTAIGLGFDVLGMLTRMPGRFLLLEDEFVKSIAYSMNLHSKAWKYAWSAQGKGNSGWVPTRNMYKDIVDNPKQWVDDIGDVHADSQDLANLITFQRDAGQIVNALSGVMQDHPYLKTMVPFMKVLTNIPKYVIQHSPLGFIGNKQFAQGGTARMREVGRMAYGTMMMMYGAHLYNNGQLVPSSDTVDFQKAMNKQELGTEEEFSLRIRPVDGGDTSFVKLGRFSPVINSLGIGADIAKGMNTWEEDHEAYSELIGQATNSLYKNLVVGTWAPNAHKLLGVLAEERDRGKKWSRALNSLVGTLQPAYVRAYEKYKDPNRSDMRPFGFETEDIGKAQYADYSKIAAKLNSVSSHSTDGDAGIYPKRNLLGEVVRSHDQVDGVAGILNNPLVSFLTFKKESDNTVLKHLFGGSSRADRLKSGFIEDLELPVKPLRPKVQIPTAQGVSLNYKMNPKEFDYYQSVLNKTQNQYNQTLLEEWEHIAKQPWYKGMDNKRQGKMNDRSDIMMHSWNEAKGRALRATIAKFDLEKKAYKTSEDFHDKITEERRRQTDITLKLRKEM